MTKTPEIKPERPRKGGARPGAGRKPKLLSFSSKVGDPKVFLTRVMRDPAASARIRVDAAKALLPFVHARKTDTGKKEAKQAEARKVAKGKFAPGTPPKLALIRPDTKS